MDAGPAVRLLSVQGSEEELLAALLFEAAASSEDEARAAIRNLPPDERAAMLAELVGDRRNRRHRPGRGFEALRYRFEVVSDYGAFRDLQRHRMLTVQWQTLGPELGAGVPEELEAAGVADAYRAGIERSRAEHERIVALGRPELAPYALCLGFRIRYILDMNAREAMQMIELRSGREGHPAYRAVAHALHARDRARPPLGRGGDDLRRSGHRAAARAHPVRDPGARAADGAHLAPGRATFSPRNGWRGTHHHKEDAP